MKTSVRSPLSMFLEHDIQLVFPIQSGKKFFYGLLSTTLLIGVILRFYDPYTFPLTTLRIQGNFYTSQQDIMKVLSTHRLTTNLLTVDLVALQTALLTLPWVRGVHFQKHWPHTLVIFFDEHHPIALWQSEQPASLKGIILVSDQGELFEVPFLPPQLSSTTDEMRLPIFIGSPYHIRQMLAHYHSFNKPLQKLQLNIVKMVCDTQQAWYLILNNGIQLILGRGDITSRVQRFINIYRRLHWVQKNMTIDLRYTHGLAVQTYHEENHAKR